MIQLLGIYKWTILAGVFSGVALTLIGSQLAARSQAVQSLVISQSASFGISVGLTVSTLLFKHGHEDRFLFPLFFGILISGLIYFTSEKYLTHKTASKNTHYIGLFTILMALSYAIISLVPNLETHMSASYFGDISLVSNAEAQMITALSLISIFIVNKFWNTITLHSYQTAIFDHAFSSEHEKNVNKLFVALALIVITASVLLLGLLFTLACLFIPTLILAANSKSFKYFKLKLSLVAAIGVVLGIVFSLYLGALPTVPSICISLLIVALLFPAKKGPQ